MLIVYAMFFDAVDGRVARMTRTQSAIGVQLDSLADVISFGVAPGVLVYRWSLDELHVGNFHWLGIAFCFIYIAAGLVRLARFNVLAMDSDGKPAKPGKYIMGLPIPAAAGILVSIVVANTRALPNFGGSPIVISAVVLGLAFLMVSTVKFRSFKDLQPNFRVLASITAIIAISIVLAFKFHLSVSLVWLLGAYVVLGVTESLFQLAKRMKRGA